MDAGADVTKVDLNGSTPVHSAARVGAVGVISLFAEKGVRVDARDAHGLTALVSPHPGLNRSVLREDSS